VIDTLRTRYFELAVAADGTVGALIDRKTGADLRAPGASIPLAWVTVGKRSYPATSLRAGGGTWLVGFGDSGITASLWPVSCGAYATLEVVSVSGPASDLTFLDLPLALTGAPTEAFAVCVLALNLRTNVQELPKPSSRLRASCAARFGFAGAKAAIVGCPPRQMRAVLQQAVAEAPDVPHSPIGGPRAMGQKITQGSYLFNFGDMSAAKVEPWIRLAKTLGMNQIDFHGGSSFRFGDCHPNPKTYPRGFASFKAVVDQLHAAGIKAGLHTYAFFIDKQCPWVTPVPDPRLAYSEVFTLSAPLPARADEVPVIESTKAVSEITGFFVRNSVTLRLDQELITYTQASKKSPWRFTGCQRGACGTKVTAHPAGTKAYHLKECFGLFVPDPETTLLAEVAQRNADAFNEVGFDMIYLDALDGEDILGGGEYAWHYGSRFVWELWARLKKPALMEMSTFHHHLWYVRSRLGAWDHPRRSHKEFIDAHVLANRECHRIFLPGQLGWWACQTWSGPQGEPTFADDIEYLMGKGLGTDTGFALMGIDPKTIRTTPALGRLAEIIRRYEGLRHGGQVRPSVKKRLAALQTEHTLLQTAGAPPRFAPVARTLHRVEAKDGPTATWTVKNPYAAQPLRLRIEALMSAAPYDSPEGVPLPASAVPRRYTERAAAPGVTMDIRPSADRPARGLTVMELIASNANPSPRGAWCSAIASFAVPLGLSQRQALGLWVHGDGQGEVLNLQLRSPAHLVSGIGDHYVPIDFTGWRYLELIEPEGRRWADYQWPYGDLYSIYREGTVAGAISSLGLWYNHLPPGGRVACRISEVRALPLVPTRLIHPAIRVGDREVVFPVEMESGCYLELNGPGDCRLYGPKGRLLRQVKPRGELPVLASGENAVRFRCDAPAGVSARAGVNVWTLGRSFRAY
jgi:hypothetical protein